MICYVLLFFGMCYETCACCVVGVFFFTRMDCFLVCLHVQCDALHVSVFACVGQKQLRVFGGI